jgi:type VI secretion system secreted protein VgrG
MDLPIELKELDVILVAGGLPLRVVEAEISEGMSQLTRARVIISSPVDLDLEPVLDEEAVLTITSGGIPVRAFSLRLTSSRFVAFIDQTIRYELEFYPTFHFLNFRRDTCKFRDRTTEQIIDEVLDENGVAHEWQTTRACDLRPYTVQYRETDKNFVQRLLEHEGIFFTFDDFGTMLLGDASGSQPELLETFSLIETSEAGVHERAGITEFERGAVFYSGAAAVNDHNWKTPYQSLLAAERSELDGDFETYEYPVGFRQEAQGKLLAKLRLEAHVCQKKFVEGKSSVVAFRAGTIFNFAHFEAYDFSGRYSLVEVKHTIVTRDAKGAPPKYANRFRAIPAEVPFRPAVVTPRPVIIGNHTAMVRGPYGEEIHTDTFGRAKVQFHWDRDANGLDDSRWIRTLQEASTSIVLARVGWETSVGYIDGDPDRPMGLGRQINGQMTPEYQVPKFMNRMSMKTESYPGKAGFNELRMDDSAGNQFMDFHAQRDFSNTVEKDKTETIGNDYKQLVKLGQHRSVGGNQDVSIGGNEKRQIGLEFGEKVEINRTEKVGGNEKVDVQLTYMLNIGKDSTEEVTGNRSTHAGEASPQQPDPPELMEDIITSNDQAFTDGVADQAPNQVMQPHSPAPLAEPAAAEAPAQEDASSEGEGSGGEGEGSGEERVVIQRRVDQNFEKTIKGSYMRLASEGQISSFSGDLLEEQITGTKHTTSEKANILCANGGDFTREVTGNIVRSGKGRVTTSAKDSKITIDGDMLMESSEQVEVRGQDIELVAETSINFKSSELEIEMTQETISIKGNLKFKSKGDIVYTSSRDKLAGS